MKITSDPKAIAHNHFDKKDIWSARVLYIFAFGFISYMSFQPILEQTWFSIVYIVVVIYLYNSYMYLAHKVPTVDLKQTNKISLKDLQQDIINLSEGKTTVRLLEKNLHNSVVKKTGSFKVKYEHTILLISLFVFGGGIAFAPLLILLFAYQLIARNRLEKKSILSNLVELYRQRYDVALLKKYLSSKKAVYSTKDDKKSEFDISFSSLIRSPLEIKEREDYISIKLPNTEGVEYGEFLLQVPHKDSYIDKGRYSFLQIHKKSKVDHPFTIINESYHANFIMNEENIGDDIDLGVSEFSDFFSIYCNTGMDARRILSAKNMQLLLDIDKPYSFQAIHVTKDYIGVVLEYADIFSWLGVEKYHKNCGVYIMESNKDKIKRINHDMKVLNLITQDIIKIVK